MGNYAYDYLSDSLLLDYSLVKNNYQSISEDRLRLELQKYREHCLKSLVEINTIINPAQNILSCMATDSMSSIRALKQAALYLDQVVLSDPFFELTNFKTDYDTVYSKFIGIDEDTNIDRVKLAKAANFLIELKPLVAGGYAKFYPVTLELEREKEEIPLLHSSNGFEDVLPKNILNLYKNMANVRSVEAVDNCLRVMRELYPCRRISISFNEMLSGFSMGYLLSEAKYTATEEKNRFEVVQTIPDTAPDQDNFDSWVNQSINQTARNHFKELTTRIAISHRTGSMFCSEHEFESKLLNFGVNQTSKEIPENTINCMLNMNLPFLNNVSSLDLMNIRNNDGEQFSSFRKELEKTVRAARHETDPIKIQQIVDDAQHELFEVQVSQISPLVKNIKRTHFAEAGIGILGLGASVATSGVSLLATLIAALQGVKSQSDYNSKVHTNPCHFLWKVKESAK